MLIRFQKDVSKWRLGFSRLAETIRPAIWMKIDLAETLRIYGTANSPKRPEAVEKQLYFRGFEPYSSISVGQHMFQIT